MTLDIELVPARPLPASPTSTDVLVRVTPGAPDPGLPSAPLDLALVLDTSGSMNGLPLDLARAAAAQVYHHLRPTNRLGLVAFANEAQVVAPLQFPRPNSALLAGLERLQAGGSTALHAGWMLGADLLSSPDSTALPQPRRSPHRLGRVLLLTDGRANLGPRHASDLAAEAARLLPRGVTTSTVGVGLRYDEQVLEAVAGAGDGNYHYAETPAGLENLFLAELESLRQTVGRLVSLEVRGAEVKDVLNDLPRLPNGRLALPPLRAGRPLEVLVRVRAQAGDRLTLRLAWTDGQNVRRVERPELVFPETDPGPPNPDHPEVVQVRAALLVARVQRQVAELTDRGDLAGALVRLGEGRGRLLTLAAQGVDVAADLAGLARLEVRLRGGERQAVSKEARSRAYRQTTGREG